MLDLRAHLARKPIVVVTDGGKLRKAGLLVERMLAALNSQAVGMLVVREQVVGEEGEPASDRELLEILRMARPHCAESKLIVHGRADLALIAGADGVHLGGHSLLISEVRSIVPSTYILGISAHSPEEVRKSEASYCFLSPIFPPLSKISVRTAIGVEGIAECRGSHPVIALGGVTAERVGACKSAGAAGVAAITSVVGANDPKRAADELMDSWIRSGK